MTPLALLALGSLFLVPGGQDSTLPPAPDGRPGLGTIATVREYGRFFRSPTDEEAAFLRRLEDLEPDTRVLAEMVRRSYRERGYFSLLGRLADQRLEDLYARFEETLPVGLPLVAGGGEAGEAFASMLLDLRFRARANLIAGVEFESREIEDGLALLGATQSGFVELKDTEARAIAWRVDLAASMLRAIRNDLIALRERGNVRVPGSPDPAWMVELIGLSKIRDEEQRRLAYDGLQKKVDHRLGQLRSVLFTPRLRDKLSDELDRRAVAIETAAELAKDVRLYLLEPPEGTDPPPDVLRLPKHDRYRYALSAALQGLALDPLNEELTFRVGWITDYLYRPEDSRQWFDRYLAMRGIRVDQHQTTAGRQLTEWEEHAREVVLRNLTGAVRPGR